MNETWRLNPDTASTALSYRADFDAPSGADDDYTFARDILEVVGLMDPNQVDDQFILMALQKVRNKDLPGVLSSLNELSKSEAVNRTINMVYGIRIVASAEAEGSPYTNPNSAESILLTEVTQKFLQGEEIQERLKITKQTNDATERVLNARSALSDLDTYRTDQDPTGEELPVEELLAIAQMLSEDIFAQKEYHIAKMKLAKRIVSERYQIRNQDPRVLGAQMLSEENVEFLRIPESEEVLVERSNRIARIRENALRLAGTSLESWINATESRMGEHEYKYELHHVSGMGAQKLKSHFDALVQLSEVPEQDLWNQFLEFYKNNSQREPIQYPDNITLVADNDTVTIDRILQRKAELITKVLGLKVPDQILNNTMLSDEETAEAVRQMLVRAHSAAVYSLTQPAKAQAE